MTNYKQSAVEKTSQRPWWANQDYPCEDDDGGSEQPPDEDDPDDPDDDEDDETEPQSFTEQIEQQVHSLVNEHREAEGISPLNGSEELAEVARYHSEDMAERDYFDHTSPDGDDLGDRYEQFGIECWSWGENISWRSNNDVEDRENAEDIAEGVVDGWLGSGGHRRNIEDGDYGAEGIGVAVDGREAYVTQVFCGSTPD